MLHSVCVRAISAHLNAHDVGFIPGLAGVACLLVSFFSQNAARKGASPYALAAMA
ncbi:hypothetical protein [Arenibacterium sp. LLYu02]|uniref:hypothetical protein n=1 Tax=Arenibacterium sp. LLYu02 TaxID=3404132 RepID=UPI003B2249BD